MESKHTERLYRDANLERANSRRAKFERIRLIREQAKVNEETSKLDEQVEELDYLHLYPPERRQRILSSLVDDIPNPLPPLAPETISYYRRSNLPIYQTKERNSNELDPHMTFESLNILGETGEKKFANFGAIVKQFQSDFKHYLAFSSHDIHIMAFFSAGNKVIGRQKDILKLVEQFPDALWVLVNHIFQKKISYREMLRHLIAGKELAFYMYYQYSNIKGHESIAWLMDNEDAVDAIIGSLNSNNHNIIKHSIRFLGNVLGQDHEYASLLINCNILDRIFKLLISPDLAVRRGVCFFVSNFCCDHATATAILRKRIVAEKLVDLLYNQTDMKIRRQISIIFQNLTSRADKRLAFESLVSKELLLMMGTYLGLGDTGLAEQALGVVKNLLVLGDEFRDEAEQNVVALMVLSNVDLNSELLKMRESENYLVSTVCEEIFSYLGSQQRMINQC